MIKKDIIMEVTVGKRNGTTGLREVDIKTAGNGIEI